MSDVKRLLDEATPLPWRQSGTPEKPHWYVSGPDVLVHGPAMERGDHVQETIDRWTADAALIVHAVNRLPDYEAAVDALAEISDAYPHRSGPLWATARKAVARLRGDR